MHLPATNAPAFLPGRFVTYETPRGATVQAVIKRMHADRSATVEARYRLNDAGEPVGKLIGELARKSLADLTPL